MNTKKKFNIFSSVRQFFKRKPSELEGLVLEFLKGDGYKKFAEEQSRAMQENYYRLKEIERQRMMKEKYDYLKHRIEKGLTMSNEQQKEFEFVKFLCERK
jgi:hypothetical protein